MAMEQLKGGFMFPIPVQPSGSTMALNSLSIAGTATDFGASIWVAQKTGTLETIEILAGTGTAGAITLRISVQAIDATTGDPTGTKLVYRDYSAASIASGTWIVPSQLTDTGAGGGNPLSVTKGNRYFLHVGATSGSCNIATLRSVQAWNFYASNEQGAGQSKTNTDALVAAVKYSDGSYYALSPQTAITKTIATSAINTGTTPDEVGTYFSFPANVLIGGISAKIDLDGDCELRIYDDTYTVLRTVSLDKDIRNNTSQGEFFGMFSDLLIEGNRRYVAAIRPTTATSLTPCAYTVNSAAMLLLQGGTDPWSWVERTDNGTWTETTTKRPFMSVFVTGIDHEIGGALSVGFEGDA